MAKENFDRLLQQLTMNRMMLDDDDDDHTLSDRSVDDRGQNCSFLETFLNPSTTVSDRRVENWDKQLRRQQPRRFQLIRV